MPKETLSKVQKQLALKKDARKKSFPTSVQPMLATLTHEYFYKANWMYERKFDGERCIAFKKGKIAHLKSRNDLSLDISYPEIRNAVAKITGVKSVILDGEVVAFKGRVTSFERLQPRMHISSQEKIKTRSKVYYYIFDLLYVDGYDVTKLPLIERKRILRKLFPFKDPLRFTIYKFKTSAAYYKGACKKGWEGLIVKDMDSKYVHKRSPSWLKFKCVADQELVIGGYTEPKGSRVGFGALLLGYYKRGKLHYAGKVGTGFDESTLRALKKRFDKIETKKNPFINYDDSLQGVHWVRPVMVCEVGFEEWTKDNKLRHPRYQGLRLDKPAKKVVQEI